MNWSKVNALECHLPSNIYIHVRNFSIVPFLHFFLSHASYRALMPHHSIISSLLYLFFKKKKKHYDEWYYKTMKPILSDNKFNFLSFCTAFISPYKQRIKLLCLFALLTLSVCVSWEHSFTTLYTSRTHWQFVRAKSFSVAF